MHNSARPQFQLDLAAKSRRRTRTSRRPAARTRTSTGDSEIKATHVQDNRVSSDAGPRWPQCSRTPRWRLQHNLTCARGGRRHLGHTSEITGSSRTRVRDGRCALGHASQITGSSRTRLSVTRSMCRKGSSCHSLCFRFTSFQSGGLRLKTPKQSPGIDLLP